MTLTARLPRFCATLAVSAALAAISPSAPATADLHDEAETIDIAAHWAARATLANAVMPRNGQADPFLPADRLAGLQR